MKAVLIAATILALASSAGAQLLTPQGLVTTECGPTPREVPLPVPAKVIPPQMDLPEQLKGKGTKAVIEVNASGVAVGWWVPKTDGATLYLYAATWGFIASNPGLAAKLALLTVVPGGDTATVAAIGAAHEPTLDLADMCDVWNPMVPALNASKPPPRPEWAAIGGTIFIANAAGTALTGVTTRKAPVGQACSTTVAPITVGTRTFYPLAGGPAAERTECKRTTVTGSVQDHATVIASLLTQQRETLERASAALTEARRLLQR